MVASMSMVAQLHWSACRDTCNDTCQLKHSDIRTDTCTCNNHGYTALSRLYIFTHTTHLYIRLMHVHRCINLVLSRLSNPRKKCSSLLHLQTHSLQAQSLRNALHDKFVTIGKIVHDTACDAVRDFVSCHWRSWGRRRRLRKPAHWKTSYLTMQFIISLPSMWEWLRRLRRNCQEKSPSLEL